MTATVQDRRAEYTPAEDYECTECQGHAVADITVRPQHKPGCPVRKHVARIRAAARKARAS